MKSYTITVNGNVYDVTVEETGASQAAPAAAAPAPRAAAPLPQQLQRHLVRQAALKSKQAQQARYSSWNPLSASR